MPYTKRTIVDRNCASIKGKGEKYAENALIEDLYSFFLKYKSNRGYVVKWDASKYFDHIEQGNNEWYRYLLEIGKISNKVQKIIKEDNSRIRRKLKHINQL